MDRRLPLLAAAIPSLASACMGVGTGSVRFAGQRNIVVWDAAHEVEHFVRDARFETPGKSLGFLAPTPTRPQIEAVDGSAFATLAALAPRPPSFGITGGFGGSGGADGGVSVIERKLVAGYEATVLKASDGPALGAWMRDNGYPLPGFATDWLARYVQAGWYVTAFKVAAADGKGATGPVRMSFGARTPFNPYSVPAENRGTGGLSLYYISSTDEVAKIGRTDPWASPQWTAKVDDRAAQALNRSLKLDDATISAGATVKFYRDPSFGRPGFDDVYFVPAPPTMPFPTHGAFPLSGALASLGVFAFVRVGRRSC